MGTPTPTAAHDQNPPTSSKPTTRQKPHLLSDGVLFLGGALVALLLVWSIYSFTNPGGVDDANFSDDLPPPDPLYDPPDPTFYDDPDVTYTFAKKIRNWDQKRRRWMELHPSFSSSGERVLMLTGSQPTPCTNPIGDHLLLRLFKNKVDYCRIHDCDVFYNNVLLHPHMPTFWAKYPAVRAAMVAHPEAEWIWWVDSDAAITDMDFKLPLGRYRSHNLVVHGWNELIRGRRRSWTGLNAGVFLIRNCQWSMDLMERWVAMGPQSPDFQKWGTLQRAMFPDKMFPASDDQTGLACLINDNKGKWADKIYLEGEYYFQGYWVEILPKLERIAERYRELEQRTTKLRRRRAEKEGEWYGGVLEQELRAAGAGSGGKRGWKRPFITHFTGCQPCSGMKNDAYEGDSCWRGMEKALNFADDQVLRSFGYVHHPGLLNSSTVVPLPFGHDEGA